MTGLTKCMIIFKSFNTNKWIYLERQRDAAEQVGQDRDGRKGD